MTIASLFTPSIITITVSVVLIAITRVFYILCQSGKPLYPSKSPKPLSTLIVLGSGGHTAEMINVLNVLLLKDRFCPRFYVAAGTDNMSLQKAHLLEENVFNLNEGPQVVLCNGPGTCVPLCVIAFLFKVVGVRWSSVFYVESIARVRKLSLSGLLLYKLRIADQFFVQWPQLQRKYPRAHYVGCLM
ncbi:hypothetical protein OIU85_002136 [Salix viminalis]|uniref:UDP-N-acetylglucosamine transferase subunit ALG14 n=1 Tax=Salix viminalis TaxID=40686 RepID=A0A9Q0ZYJ3_SALVM|nr:hypothetical protein OIU85_002136 [Salix viminalis]